MSRRFFFILMSLSGVFYAALHVVPARAFEGHSLAIREPYLPQKIDLGLALGSSFNLSDYGMVEAFGGVRTTKCAFHCFDYIDLSFRAMTQNGETSYQSLMGWRFQRYFDDSMWGPYLRSFGGINHYLYQGQIKDTGVFGGALGTYYFLHPGADLRIETGYGFGPTSWAFITLGFVFKFRNI